MATQVNVTRATEEKRIEERRKRTRRRSRKR
jgi:hypothetical protein